MADSVSDSVSSREKNSMSMEDVGMDDDGLGYSSSDSDDDSVDDESGLDLEVCRRYAKQVQESEGFDIIDYPGDSADPDIIPSDLTFEDEKKDVTGCAIQALNRYNEQFGTKFVFSKLLWATHTFVAGLMRYITFEAAEGGRTDDPAAVKKFQAKVYEKWFPREIEVEFCRLRKEQEVAFEPFVYPTNAPEVYLLDLTREGEKEIVTDCVMEALKHYNEQSRKNFVLSNLNYANESIVGDGRLLYITFEAKEAGKRFGRKFQAKVLQIAPSMEIQVMFCRQRSCKDRDDDEAFQYRTIFRDY